MTSDHSTSNELIDRIAKAMYNQIAHTVPWEQAFKEHQDMWRRYAVAAVQELIAIRNIKAVFPEARQVQ